MHLTAIISKVFERVVGRVIQPFFVSTGAFGQSQWAFQKGIGAADLVAEIVMSSLLAFQRKLKVGIYLSDISGAFDKVETALLMRKLRATGLSEKMLLF